MHYGIQLSNVLERQISCYFFFAIHTTYICNLFLRSIYVYLYIYNPCICLNGTKTNANQNSNSFLVDNKIFSTPCFIKCIAYIISSTCPRSNIFSIINLKYTTVAIDFCKSLHICKALNVKRLNHIPQYKVYSTDSSYKIMG